MDLLKKYFKKYKKFLYKMEDIEDYIRGLSKQQINMNKFVNLKNLIQIALLQLDKEIYIWPLNNATIIIDKAHGGNPHLKHFQKSIDIEYVKPEIMDKFPNFKNEKLIVVQDECSF